MSSSEDDHGVNGKFGKQHEIASHSRSLVQHEWHVITNIEPVEPYVSLSTDFGPNYFKMWQGPNIAFMTINVSLHVWQDAPEGSSVVSIPLHVSCLNTAGGIPEETGHAVMMQRIEIGEDGVVGVFVTPGMVRVQADRLVIHAYPFKAGSTYRVSTQLFYDTSP
jgi:hypothetical protein